MAKTSSYRGGSYTEKTGEFVAAIHLSIVCHSLKTYMKGKKTFTITGYGLQIHRVHEIVCVVVTLGPDKMKIDTNLVVDGTLSSELLCSAIVYFMNKLQKT